MPSAKFGPEPLKAVAVHKEQRNRQTDRQTRYPGSTHVSNRARMFVNLATDYWLLLDTKINKIF